MTDHDGHSEELPARARGLAPTAADLAGHRRGYYWRACGYCATSDVLQRSIGLRRNAHCEQYRIRDLGLAWGTRLDDLHASLQMVRWVADVNPSRYAAERERRYRALVQLLESTDRDENASMTLPQRFRTLKQQFAKVGRAAKRATR